MFLRRETPDDRAAIVAVHAAAFGGTPGIDPPEARVVDALRDAGDLIPRLSIVAITDGEVIGHVACSRAHVDGCSVLVLLAPLGVVPAHQCRGVGTALMHAVLSAADALDEPAVAVLGDPGFYRRFGFLPARNVGILPPNPRSGEHLQLRRLTAWTDSIIGTLRYPPPLASL